jgi:predicted nuclease of predicted toxin-antitoxin system
VKLLFDHNLSFRLVAALADLYPDSVHVRDVGLQTALDESVWHYALDHGLSVISKDADFHQRSLVFGAPPKVVWIAVGNCSTDEIEALLRRRHHEVLAFGTDPEATFLALA